MATPTFVSSWNFFSLNKSKNMLSSTPLFYSLSFTLFGTLIQNRRLDSDGSSTSAAFFLSLSSQLLPAVSTLSAECTVAFLQCLLCLNCL